MGKGNYFLEIQEHGLEGQQRIRKPLVELSKKTGVPLVATNDAHYLSPEDARAHDVLLCIGSGKTVNDTNRLRYASPNFYVRSPEEMWRIFGSELPNALTRTIEIAQRCDLKLPENINHLPNYPIPVGEGASADDYFEKVVRQGFERRSQKVWERQQSRGELRYPISDYQTRLAGEIAMIKQMGFAGYFLIVWDFVHYAKEHSIPVGPGRGSSAGSLVYLLMKENEELRGIVNASHTRDTARVLRTVGDHHEPRYFSTWCPKFIALIEPPARSQWIGQMAPMRRKRAGDRVEPIRGDRFPTQCRPLRRQILRWVDDHRPVLQVTDPDVPASLDRPGGDNCRPLLTIADAAGGNGRPGACRDRCAPSRDSDKGCCRSSGTLVGRAGTPSGQPRHGGGLGVRDLGRAVGQSWTRARGPPTLKADRD